MKEENMAKEQIPLEERNVHRVATYINQLQLEKFNDRRGDLDAAEVVRRLVIKYNKGEIEA